MKSKSLAALMVGLAWASIGLGFNALHFGYFPSGIELVVFILGMVLGGAGSSLLLMSLLNHFERRFARILIMIGYLLFAPIGLMTAMLMAGSITMQSGIPMLVYLLAGPIPIALFGNLAVGVGLSLTAGLSVMSFRLSQRVEGILKSPEAVQVRA
ncbi:MAG: hypothetical protein JXA97_03965 [Anaerolineales bacterium]|nr:hypothetical protein [Anaerolineales bacterium]